MLVATVAACAGAPRATTSEAPPVAQPTARATPVRQGQRAPRKVLAFYYGWYGNPALTGRWRHWRDVNVSAHTIGTATHYPELGPYDSHDSAVVAKHCAWAKDAGIDAFIVSWWGRGSFEDKSLRLMLATARRYGIQITAYLETVPSRTKDEALDLLAYLLREYGDDDAWLKVDGRPVLFVYGRAIQEIGLDGWRWVLAQLRRRYSRAPLVIADQPSPEAAAIFDGIHTYNIAGAIADKSPSETRAWARKEYPAIIGLAGDRIACLTVIPGYEDGKLGRPEPRPRVDRHGGDTYRILWEATIAARPDWVLITSWNEWHEGSEIEPSLENGNRELKATRQFAIRFKAGS
jgi:glycoprotein endo-alpha-1,2-mannosidase